MNLTIIASNQCLLDFRRLYLRRMCINFSLIFLLFAALLLQAILIIILIVVFFYVN